ncbi:peptidase [Enterococcus sp. JM4C]|uniref:PepSY domain-containing protein n=1 Tax=Candidatus Enterococcus huntleyi TaxID=1857217 RepID=UPI00137A1854|nr:PepSY domain-containing protein [Enterococcus sp. JM4C]KAF1299143.1 peptidase [Enterococcus sp. JM4C]
MNEDNQINYFKGGLALGMGFGLVSGVASTIWYHKKRTLSPDQVLEAVKAAFLVEGPIDGSWISFEKHPLRKFAIRSQGYLGGISRIEDGQLVQYEFIADAFTGTVIDVTRLKNN